VRSDSAITCVFSSILIVAFSTSCTQKLPNYPPAYREYAYVTNGKSNTVSVLDMRNYRSVTTIPVGLNPTGVVANSEKNEVYVVNTASNTLSVIDAEQNKVVATIGLERRPYFVDVSRDGLRAYVGNAESNSVSVVDLRSRRVLRNIPVGSSPGMARVSRNGKLVVVAERLGNSVSVIDTEKMAVRSSVPICQQPTDVVILSDSSKAFVACSGSAQVAVIGLNLPVAQTSGQEFPTKRQSSHSRKLLVPTVKIVSGPDRLLTLLDVGKTPVHLALKPDGGEIFVSNFDADTISEIATGANEVGGTYVIGAGPVRAVISADSSTLYVSNFNSDTIGVYSIDDGKLVASVHVGSRPDALALSPNQNFLFVADTAAGDVSVVRTAARQGAVLLTIIPVGQQPNAIAIKAFLLRKPPAS
jgi:YVTN family beta-propeller protein